MALEFPSRACTPHIPACRHPDSHDAQELLNYIVAFMIKKGQFDGLKDQAASAADQFYPLAF